MPLLINDLVYDENNFKNFYQFYSLLKETCNQFLTKPIQLISSPKFLFVSQGEYCIVNKNDDNIDYVGSDEATTCCLLFMETTESYAIAHLDNSLKFNSLINLIDELIDTKTNGDHLNSKLNCKLIGSYNDEKQNSFKFIYRFLRNLNNIPNVDIDLKLACLLDMNTKIISTNNEQFNCPIIYGAAVHLKTNEIVPAEFQNRGPEIILRRARRTCSTKDLVQVYNSNTKLFIINEFRYFRINHIDFLTKADDQYILNNFSTSPKVEPDHFANSIRDVFSLMKTNKILEPTHKFRRESDGKWTEVQLD